VEEHIITKFISTIKKRWNAEGFITFGITKRIKRNVVLIQKCTERAIKINGTKNNVVIIMKEDEQTTFTGYGAIYPAEYQGYCVEKRVIPLCGI
jgi:hypothetical protein